MRAGDAMVLVPCSIAFDQPLLVKALAGQSWPASSSQRSR
jgi:hypothetical protein